jgi:hypothetical protein
MLGPHKAKTGSLRPSASAYSLGINKTQEHGGVQVCGERHLILISRVTCFALKAS